MIAVRVYASRVHPDTYLFVAADDDLARVPEALRARLEPLREALELELDSETRLAQAEAADVLAQLHSEGFYLQLPPPLDSGTTQPAG